MKLLKFTCDRQHTAYYTMDTTHYKLHTTNCTLQTAHAHSPTPVPAPAPENALFICHTEH